MAGLTSSSIELLKKTGTAFSYVVNPSVKMPYSILWKDDIELYSAVCFFQASAALGDREMEMRINDPSGDSIGGWSSAIGPTPGQNRRIAWGVGNFNDDDMTSFYAQRTMPRIIIPAGYTLEILDTTNTDPTLDNVRMMLSGYMLGLGTLTP